MEFIQPYGKTFVIALWFIVIAEALSLLAHTFAVLQVPLFVLIALTVLGLSIWRLHYGLLIALGELFIGSFGYLFFWDVGDFRISIRLAIFVALIVAWLFHIARRKHIPFLKSPFVKPLTLFFLFLLTGVVMGIISGNTLKDVFLDVNGYLYFGLMPVIFSVVVSWKRVSQILQLLFAAVTTMAIKTFILVFYFAHQTDKDLFRAVYTWVRNTRVGEISIVLDNFYRIFFQGHLWSLVVLIISIVMLLASKNDSRATRRVYWIMTLLSSTTLIISLSRSLWLGLAITLSLIAIWSVRSKVVSYRTALKIIGLTVLIITVELFFITFLVNVPIPGSSSNSLSAGSLVKERLTTIDEPAVGSRFQLLKPLAEKVMQKPLLGHGFATTVSYQSLDPRTKDVDGGLYTTYSLEWGYLEIVLKIGAIGLLAYLYFLWRVTKVGLIVSKFELSKEKTSLITSLLFALAGVVTIHFTTPYLNHPLGITLIMLSSSIFYLAYREKRTD